MMISEPWLFGFLSNFTVFLSVSVTSESFHVLCPSFALKLKSRLDLHSRMIALTHD